MFICFSFLFFAYGLINASLVSTMASWSGFLYTPMMGTPKFSWIHMLRGREMDKAEIRLVLAVNSFEHFFHSTHFLSGPMTCARNLVS